MTVAEAVRARRSIRQYQSRPVQEEVLKQLLEAARLAPSASNKQRWKIIVVRDAELRKKLAAAAKNQTFVAQAPLVIAICGVDTDYVMSCGQPAYAADATIAMDHLTLVAAELGLGTCWLGSFYEDQVKELLGIPEKVRVVSMTPLGYPAEAPTARPRKSLEELVAYERWK